MNVMAWPGMMRRRRGVMPFHNAGAPSSLAIKIQDWSKPLYLGFVPSRMTCFCILVLTTSGVRMEGGINCKSVNQGSKSVNEGQQ